MKPSLVWTFLIAIVAVQGATAQDFIANQGAVMSGIANTAAMNDVLRNTYGRSGGTGRLSPRTARQQMPGMAAAFDKGTVPNGVAPRLSYVPTPALQKQARDGVLLRLRTKNPEAARQLATEMAKHDFSHIFTDIFRSYGLRSDDAADAVTAYMLLGWGIVHNADVSPSVARAMRDRTAISLAANPTLSRQRAALGEEMKILAVSLHAGWQSAQREHALAAFTDGVVKLFRQQAGVDLRNVRLG